MTSLFLIGVLIVGLRIIGCNKKQDELDAIQQDAADQDAAVVIDSLGQGEGEAVEETAEYETPTLTETEAVRETAEPEPDYSQFEGFVIQLGSYSDYELATYWSEKYQNRDLPAFLRQVELDGQTFWRLRIGVYDTYGEAKEVGDLLVDRYSAAYWIDNNR